MNCVLSVKLFIISILLEYTSGEPWYEAQFTDSILPCEDFENKAFQADGIHLGKTDGSDDEEPGFGLSGPIVVNEAVEDDINVNLNIFKDTELGQEYMFKSCINMCESMKDEDTPWFPVFKMMNISSCPIEPGSYNIKNFVLSLDTFSGVLSRDFCGDYQVEMSLVKELDKVSCHMIQVSIVEHDDDE